MARLYANEIIVASLLAPSMRISLVWRIGSTKPWRPKGRGRSRSSVSTDPHPEAVADATSITAAPHNVLKPTGGAVVHGRARRAERSLCP